jgi:pyruvate dehydrogenase E2 component (dihydrolipoamide acetyltransferase)
MPSLGADMEEGRVVEWRVHPGDVVHRGDIVAVVDTDKADIEIEVFEDGTVEELVVPEGERVAVGTVIARIGTTGGEPAPAALPASESSPAGEASPVLRRLAQHLGVDLASVAGTGPGGRVTRADVEAAAGQEVVSPAPPPEPVPVEPTRSEPIATDRAATMRASIGALMARSKREIPHYYVGTTIDLRVATSFLEARNAERPVQERVLPAALLLKASALAIHEVPEVNGHFVDGAYRHSDPVHLGVAISLRGGGLVAPAIHDADTLDLDTLMARLRELVTRARSLTLRASEMADPTITVTSLGDLGVDTVLPVIYPPQVAIVGFGAIAERPWAVDGMLGVHPVAQATLAADHRVTDGHQGARYLAAVARLLQEPEAL